MPATNAGTRKMPPPIITLMIPAARPTVPMARVNDSRSEFIRAIVC